MDDVGVRWRSQTKQAVMRFMLMALLGEKMILNTRRTLRKNKQLIVWKAKVLWKGQ